ncbi:hypothetical protein AZE42_03026, partial [Rhizopogon vesiculosus]
AFVDKRLHQEPSPAVPPWPVSSNLSLSVCASSNYSVVYSIKVCCEHATSGPDDDTKLAIFPDANGNGIPSTKEALNHGTVLLEVATLKS